MNDRKWRFFVELAHFFVGVAQLLSLFVVPLPAKWITNERIK